MKVGLVLKHDSEQAKILAGKVELMLAQKGYKSVRVDGSGKVDGLDLICVFGGDGTLLYAASLVGEKGIPILGVKIGGLGFLTEVKEEELFAMIEKGIGKKLAIDERILIKADAGHKIQYLALNDIIIGKAVMDRMIEMDVDVDGYELAHIRADGLIISTPTGSTAYCMAAAGPIVHPSVRSIILIPLCPHSLTLKPLVIPSESKLKIRVTTKGGDVHLIVDGRLGKKIHENDIITISRTKQPLKLVISPTMNYFEILRTKLGWGIK